MIIFRNINRYISSIIVIIFVITAVFPPQIAQAQILPAVGTQVVLSSSFTPPMLKGLTLHEENPFLFDFIVHPGDKDSSAEELNDESTKLIKYFMAALTVPEEEMWVNLSPYEKDRVIPEGFGDTLMGRDLLAQDYMLKQLTASLMNPENELGAEFWEKVYEEAYEEYGTTDIPMDSFSKVWIVPQRATIFQNGASVFVVDSYLKVLTDSDYMAISQNTVQKSQDSSQQILREIIIPAIEKEVNDGETFAKLRQISNSVILATWYKQNIQQGLLQQLYVDKNKTFGVDTKDKQVNQKIYDQYVEAFKKGINEIIKEDYDPVTQKVIERKYFTGGAIEDWRGKLVYGDKAQLAEDLKQSKRFTVVLSDSDSDPAMLKEKTKIEYDPKILSKAYFEEYVEDYKSYPISLFGGLSVNNDLYDKFAKWIPGNENIQWKSSKDFQFLNGGSFEGRARFASVSDNYGDFRRLIVVPQGEWVDHASQVLAPLEGYAERIVPPGGSLGQILFQFNKVALNGRPERGEVFDAIIIHEVQQRRGYGSIKQRYRQELDKWRDAALAVIEKFAFENNYIVISKTGKLRHLENWLDNKEEFSEGVDGEIKERWINRVQSEYTKEKREYSDPFDRIGWKEATIFMEGTSGFYMTGRLPDKSIKLFSDLNADVEIIESDTDDAMLVDPSKEVAFIEDIEAELQEKYALNKNSFMVLDLLEFAAPKHKVTKINKVQSQSIFRTLRENGFINREGVATERIHHVVNPTFNFYGFDSVAGENLPKVMGLNRKYSLLYEDILTILRDSFRLYNSHLEAQEEEVIEEDLDDLTVYLNDKRINTQMSWNVKVIEDGQLNDFVVQLAVPFEQRGDIEAGERLIYDIYVTRRKDVANWNYFSEKRKDYKGYAPFGFDGQGHLLEAHKRGLVAIGNTDKKQFPWLDSFIEKRISELEGQEINTDNHYVKITPKEAHKDSRLSFTIDGDGNNLLAKEVSDENKILIISSELEEFDIEQIRELSQPQYLGIDNLWIPFLSRRVQLLKSLRMMTHTESGYKSFLQYFETLSQDDLMGQKALQNAFLIYPVGAVNAIREMGIHKRFRESLVFLAQDNLLGYEALRESFQNSPKHFNRILYELANMDNMQEIFVQLSNIHPERGKQVLRQAFSYPMAFLWTFNKMNNAESLEEVLKYLSSEGQFGKKTVEQSFLYNSIEFLGALAWISNDFEKFQTILGKVLDSSTGKDVLSKSFSVVPHHLVSSLLLLDTYWEPTLENYFKESGFDLTEYLREEEKRVVFDIESSIASINSTNGILDAEVLDRDVARVSYIAPFTEGYVNQVINDVEAVRDRPLREGELAVKFRVEDIMSVLNFPSVPYKFFLNPVIDEEHLESMKTQMNIHDRKVVVVNSPSANEIEVVVSAFKQIPENKRPLLILGLRYPDGHRDLEKALNRRGLSTKSYSQEDAMLPDLSDSEIMLLNKKALIEFLPLANISIVGEDRNLFEPANLGLPIMYFEGRWKNNITAVQLLRNYNAGMAIEVGQLHEQMMNVLDDASELESNIKIAVKHMREQIIPNAKTATTMFLAGMLQRKETISDEKNDAAMLLEERNQAIIDSFNAEKKKFKVVDMGSGYGEFMHFYKEKNPDHLIIGFDNRGKTPEQLQLDLDTHMSVRPDLVLKDGKYTGVDARSVDLFTINMPKPDDMSITMPIFIKEANRILKPGGELIVVFQGYDSAGTYGILIDEGMKHIKEGFENNGFQVDAFNERLREVEPDYPSSRYLNFYEGEMEAVNIFKAVKPKVAASVDAAMLLDEEAEKQIQLRSVSRTVHRKLDQLPLALLIDFAGDTLVIGQVDEIEGDRYLRIKWRGDLYFVNLKTGQLLSDDKYPASLAIMQFKVDEKRKQLYIYGSGPRVALNLNNPARHVKNNRIRPIRLKNDGTETRLYFSLVEGEEYVSREGAIRGDWDYDEKGISLELKGINTETYLDENLNQLGLLTSVMRVIYENSQDLNLTISGITESVLLNNLKHAWLELFTEDDVIDALDGFKDYKNESYYVKIQMNKLKLFLKDKPALYEKIRMRFFNVLQNSPYGKVLTQVGFEDINFWNYDFESFGYDMKIQARISGKKDDAMLSDNKGGIDLNPNNIDIQTQGDLQGFQFRFDNDLINMPHNINGLVPVIINVSPVLNIPLLLGEAMQDEGSEELLSYNYNYKNTN